MPGTAGYLTTVKRGGTPTALADEPMTEIGGSPNDTFQVTDTTRRILDRTVVPTFEDTGVSPQDIPVSDVLTIDYLFGIVTFVTGKIGPVVVKTGNFIPLQFIAGAHSYNLNQAGDVLDDTTFEKAEANNGKRTRILGIRDVSLSVDRWWEATTFFFDALNNRTPILIQVAPGINSGQAGLEVARGWYVPEAENHDGDVSSLESANTSFQIDGDAKASFNWGVP